MSAWDKGHQQAHCLFTFALLVALLGEFPDKELTAPSNAYLLRSCVRLEPILIETEGLCDLFKTTKAQRQVMDNNSANVLSGALIISADRKFISEEEMRMKKELDLYSWLISWSCGYWAIQDCLKMCGNYQKRPLTWKTLKESMENIDSFIESYEEKFPDLQEDAWTLYETFLELTKGKRFKK